MGNLWAFALKKQCRRHQKIVVVTHRNLYYYCPMNVSNVLSLLLLGVYMPPVYSNESLADSDKIEYKGASWESLRPRTQFILNSRS